MMSGGVEVKLMGSYREGEERKPFFMIVREGLERELCDDEVTPLIVNTLLCCRTMMMNTVLPQSGLENGVSLENTFITK